MSVRRLISSIIFIIFVSIVSMHYIEHRKRVIK